MIPTTTVYELIKSAKSGDEKSFNSLIKKIIGIAEKKGQVKLARELRQLYNNSAGFVTPSSKNGGKFHSQGFKTKDETLFELRKSKVSLKDIILSKRNKSIFDELIINYQNKEIFNEQELDSENKVLLYGPPGTGKTLACYTLGGELGLPILHVHLDALISSYLGETGKNIKHIFEKAKNQDCILFLDEFDSIAKQRDDSNELGELKRVVTVLLQNIDELPNNVILVVATNHEYLLDRAIWRRFNYQVNLDVLDQESIKDLLKLILKESKKINLDLIGFICSGLSGGVIKNLVNRGQRKHLLNPGDSNLEFKIVNEILLGRKDLNEINTKNPETKEQFILLVKELRKWNKKYYTYQKLEDIFGIPHSTINDLTKK